MRSSAASFQLAAGAPEFGTLDSQPQPEHLTATNGQVRLTRCLGSVLLLIFICSVGARPDRRISGHSGLFNLHNHSLRAQFLFTFTWCSSWFQYP